MGYVSNSSFSCCWWCFGCFCCCCCWWCWWRSWWCFCWCWCCWCCGFSNVFCHFWMRIHCFLQVLFVHVCFGHMLVFSFLSPGFHAGFFNKRKLWWKSRRSNRGNGVGEPIGEPLTVAWLYSVTSSASIWTIHMDLTRYPNVPDALYYSKKNLVCIVENTGQLSSGFLRWTSIINR